MADPITAAVGAIVAGAKAAGGYIAGSFAAASAGTATFAQTLTVLGVNLAASTAVSLALAPSVNASGSPTEWRADPDAGLPVVLGRRGVAGQIVHRDAFGKNNRHQGIVTVYSAGPIDGFESFYANRQVVGFDAGGLAGPPYNEMMHLVRRTGEQPDTALSVPATLNDGATSLPGWGASHRLSGLACSLQVLTQDSKFESYPLREPAPIQVLRGRKLYDPRADSTYPGGSGPQRWGQLATYAYTTNPAIHALNWALGIYNNGELVAGIGLPPTHLDFEALINAANLADLNGWESHAVCSTADDKHQVYAALLQSAGALPARRAGALSAVTRAGVKPSITTISAADTAGGFSMQTSTPRRERINSVTPRCVLESHFWEEVDLDRITVDQYVTEDGGVRNRRITYPYVTDAVQAAQLAAYDIVDAREGLTAQITVKPYLRELQPGDAFIINEPEFGLVNQKFLVLARSYDPAQDIATLTIRSEVDDKHAFALGQSPTPPAPPGLAVADPFLVEAPGVGVWTATALPPGASGAETPTILVAGVTDNARAARVRVEYRLLGQTEWIVWGDFDPRSGVIPITGLEPLADYEIAISYISDNGQISERTILGVVTTGNLIASDALIPSQALQDAIDAVNDALGTAYQTIEEVLLAASANSDAFGAVSLINQVLDPGFEGGAAGWDVTPGFAEIDVSAPRGIRVGYDPAVLTGDPLIIWPVNMPADPLDDIQASVDVTAEGVADIVLEAVFYDAADGVSGVVELARGTAGRLAGIGEAPADTIRAGVRCRVVIDPDAELVWVRLARPYAAYASAGQLVPDPYQPGSENHIAVVRDSIIADAEGARRFETTQAETRNTLAAISETRQAVADETSARALAIDLLEAEIDNVEQDVAARATITQLDSVEADLTHAIAVSATQVEAELRSGPDALLSQADAAVIYLAEADLEGALALVDLGVNAAFAGLESSVSVQGLAIQDLEQDAAYLNLEAAAGGGARAAFSLFAGGPPGSPGASEIDIVSDLIRLRTSTGGATQTALAAIGGDVVIPNTLIMGPDGSIRLDGADGSAIRLGVYGANRWGLQLADHVGNRALLNLSDPENEFWISGVTLLDATITSIKVAGETIDTHNLAPGAITNAVISQFDAARDIASGWTSFKSLSLNKQLGANASRVLAHYRADVANNTADDAFVEIELVTPGAGANIIAAAAVAPGRRQTVSDFVDMLAVGAGVQTWSLRARVVSGTGARIGICNLKLEEIKR